MRSVALAPTRKVATPTLTPVPTSIVQPPCDCGQHTIVGGECAKCKEKRMALPRCATSCGGPDTVQFIVHELLDPPRHPVMGDP